MKKFIRDYLIIFAVIVILLTVLRQLSIPGSYIEIKDIYRYMVCALIANFPSLVFYTKRELTNNEMRQRVILHFVLLEICLLVFTNIMGWVTGVKLMTIFAFQIAFIYILVRWLIWREDTKSAYSINEKLQKLRIKATK